jgi:hypothetical protein
MREADVSSTFFVKMPTVGRNEQKSDLRQSYLFDHMNNVGFVCFSSINFENPAFAESVV